jgi:hypothetical protein
MNLIRLALPFALLVALLVSACGSRPTTVETTGSQQAGRDRPQVPATPPSVLGNLPAPGTVKRSSATVIDRTGADFEPTAPQSQVTVEGNAAVFSPSANPTTTEDLAYAIYTFNLEGEASRTLRLRHRNPGFLWGKAWVGLPNLTRDSWQWFLLPVPELNGFELDLEDAAAALDVAPHVAPDGSLVVAIVVLGDQPFTLEALTFTPYDEVEDNDTESEAQTFTSLNMAGFRGSHGNGPGYPGYDGDNEDIFILDPAMFTPGGRLVARVTSDRDTAGGLIVYVTTIAGEGLEDGDPQVEFDNVQPSDFPARVRVAYSEFSGEEGYSDYQLDLLYGFPPAANFTVSGNEGPGTVTLDGSVSLDQDANIIEYRWSIEDWDDEAITPYIVSAEPTLEWNFPQAGLQRVDLEVVDAQGFNDFVTYYFFVGANPYDEIDLPDLDADNPEPAQPLDPGKAHTGWLGSIGYAYWVTTGYKHYDGDSWDYFSIPLPEGMAIRPQAEKLPGFSGEVEVRAGDADEFSPLFGGPQLFNDPLLTGGGPITAIIEVATGGIDDYGDYKLTWEINTAPTASIDPVDDGPIPYTVDFNSTASDPDGGPVTYAWDFDGDGTVDSTEADPQWTFEESDFHDVELIVTDDEGFYNRVTVSFSTFG